MIKYTCKSLIDRALGLADLKNSDFLSYGELFNYTNDAYREVYQDAINHGDQNYLKAYRLEGSGSRVYDLPEDVYQIVSIASDNGIALNRKDPRDSEDAPGYTIANGKLYLSKVVGSVVLKYYPLPETITTKAKEFSIELPFTPIASYGNRILSQYGDVYDVSLEEYVYNSEEENPFEKAILGEYSYVADGVEYSFEGDTLDSGNFLLSEDGTFRKKSDDFDLGVCNSDESTVFLLKDDKLYDKDLNVIAEDLTNVKQLRYVYFDGKDGVIVVDDNPKLFYDDGSYFTLDSKGLLLKTNLETGYGILSHKGNKYFIEGWLPNTLIDYPNNIFFSMVAYRLAIAFRTKQNADVVLLTAAYDSLLKTYVSSLSIDGQNYPTIRNVYNNTSWGF